MRFSVLTLAAATTALVNAQATGKLGDAAAITNNPEGAMYAATLPNSDKNTIRGSVVASSGINGVGVDFFITVSGLPTEGGPFMYHIHDQPVPSDGNCTKTLAHHDPYERGETPPCDPSAPQTCQVGDLSGKYGTINDVAYSATYHDEYAALVEGIGAFFGNRSVVFHYANKTRITCANFEVLEKGGVGGGKLPGPPYGNGTMTTAAAAPSGSGAVGVPTSSAAAASTTTGAPSGASATPSASQFTGAASVMGVSTSAILLAALVSLMV